MIFLSWQRQTESNGTSLETGGCASLLSLRCCRFINWLCLLCQIIMEMFVTMQTVCVCVSWAGFCVWGRSGGKRARMHGGRWYVGTFAKVNEVTGRLQYFVMLDYKFQIILMLFSLLLKPFSCAYENVLVVLLICHAKRHFLTLCIMWQ